MQTYFADIIPRIKRFSEELNTTTLLKNQHWVIIDDIKMSKVVYIFRDNNELLISQNGKVTKGKWEYLGNKSLLIDKGEDSYLLKQGFLDQHVLALKVDSDEKYLFLVNENKFDGELNTIDKVIGFLKQKYLKGELFGNAELLKNTTEPRDAEPTKMEAFKTNKGVVYIEMKAYQKCVTGGEKVLLDNKPAPDGKYRIGFMDNIIIKNGVVDNISIF